MPAAIVVILLVSLVLLSKAPQGEWKLDKPISRYFSTSTTPNQRQITGILYNEDKPSALFDNNIVHEGDTINGIKVVKIHIDNVEFEEKGRRWSQAVEAAAPY